MTELQHLLDRAAGPAAAPDSADLAADVARGMRALRRRRTGAAGGLLTVAVAAAALPVALNGAAGSQGTAVLPGGSGAKSSQSANADATPDGNPSVPVATAKELSEKEATALKQAAEKVALARANKQWLPGGAPVPIHTYAGPALPGPYQPRLMPDGVVVQGGNGYRLTLAMAGDSDTNPDAFTGKIVVMLSGLPSPGDVEVQVPDEFSNVVLVPLDHPIDGATTFEVQYPAGLGWTDNEAVKFASSITVLPSALAGKG